MTELKLDEFTRRYIARLVAVAGPTFSDGTMVAEYGEETAYSYWVDPLMQWESPEAAADSDMEYWGE